jgi:hypothetical protein
LLNNSLFSREKSLVLYLVSRSFNRIYNKCTCMYMQSYRLQIP